MTAAAIDEAAVTGSMWRASSTALLHGLDSMQGAACEVGTATKGL